MFHSWPWTNLHEINLDWVIKTVKDWHDQYGSVEDAIGLALQQVEQARSESLNAIDSAKQVSLDAIGNLQRAVMDAILTTGNGKVDQITSVGDGYISSLENLKNTLSAALESKGQEVLSTLPDDYIALADDVEMVKTGLSDRAPAINEGAVSEFISFPDGSAAELALATSLISISQDQEPSFPGDYKPINGHDKAELNIAGNNLANVTNKEGTVSYYIDIKTGCSVKVGMSYTLSLDVQASQQPFSFNIGIGDEQNYKRDIATANNQNNGRLTMTATITEETLKYGKYLYFRCPRYPTAGQRTYSLKNIMLTNDNTSVYSPYNGQILTQDFGKKVYGGGYNWKSGVLSETKTGLTFTGGENFTLETLPGSDPVFSTENLTLRANYNPAVTTQVLTENTHFPNRSKEQLFTESLSGVCVYGESTWTRLLFRVPRALIGADESTSGDSLIQLWKNWISTQYTNNTPLTVVYQLFTATSSTLSTHNPRSNYGKNNIWSTPGKSAITYNADTRLYINNKISTILAISI